MPYEAAPTAELSIESARLSIRIVEPSDAPEAFELLRHKDLPFVPVDTYPPSEAALAESFERLHAGTDNSDIELSYLWAVRRRETDDLVCLVTVRLTTRADLTAAGVHEVRMAETSAYTHPDHWGNRYGWEAIALIDERVMELFGIDERIARVDPNNHQMKAKVADSGMKLRYPAGPDGEPPEEWFAPVD